MVQSKLLSNGILLFTLKLDTHIHCVFCSQHMVTFILKISFGILTDKLTESTTNNNNKCQHSSTVITTHVHTTIYSNNDTRSHHHLQ